MIIATSLDANSQGQIITDANRDLLQQALWIDLVNPSKEDALMVEQCLHLNLPDLDQMRSIELSSRLYEENGTLFMTTTMVAQSQSPTPEQDSVTFLLTPKQLISIRYIEPQVFTIFRSRLSKLRTDSPTTLFTELLDAITDRIADILQESSHKLESTSKFIFYPLDTHNIEYRKLLQQLGVVGSLNSRIIESLVSLDRLMHFFAQSASKELKTQDHERLQSLNKDTHALIEHANYLSNKISFLLEAILGLVQIEQNTIIKIFSVAAVIFLPPTLIASIYGMNFKFMPKLIQHEYGFIASIVLMLLSAWAPYKYFKYRKWL